MPTRTYWSGAKTKNAQSSARWSVRAVGASVMNSRMARKDVRAKSTIDPMPPVATATPKTATITHHARIRAFRFCTVARAFSPVARRDRTKPMADATTSSTTTPATSRPSVDCRNWRTGVIGPSLGAQRQQRVARAREERRLLCVRLEAHRRAEDHPAEQRHGEHFALGQDAVHVREVDRHELQARLHSAEVVQAALERPHLAVQAARPFGEHDDAAAVAHALGDHLDRAGRLARRARAPRAVDEDGVEHAGREVAAQRTPAP